MPLNLRMTCNAVIGGKIIRLDTSIAVLEDGSNFPLFWAAP
ncbi:MAG: hypothetical protein WC574_05385 [Candidatus Omnitrophota bacterium]